MAALLTARTTQEAAATAGVGLRTLERWLTLDAFTRAYRDSARDASRQAVTALLAAQLEAVATLRQAMREGTPATRTRAARALLEVGVRLRESDLDERIDNLEGEVQRWRMTGGVAPVWRGWSA